MEDIKKKEELSEEKLEQVSGGELPITWALDGCEENENPHTVKVLRRDGRGNPVYWQSGRDGRFFFYVCPHCGRVLHEGTLSRLYCDPCDEGWFSFNLPDGCKRYGSFPG